MLVLRLPENTEQRLDQLAALTGRTKSYYAREALNRFLAEMEDVYIAEKVLERVRRGEERIYSSEEMEKILELDD